VNVLGIETSCDETAAAVVRGPRTVLSNCVFSQVALHQPFGGVVPEIAARSHVEVLPATIESAVRESGGGWVGIDAVACTQGPGLATSLLVGIAAAKALALRLQRPLCAVNHIEGHLRSVFLAEDAPAEDGLYPMLALVVSGGHTSLVRVEATGRYRVLGQTVDDAAGEAFDKGASLLGLGYPGGPAVQKAAEGGDPRAVRFPRGRQRAGRMRLEGLDPALCFSFSGLKTALLYRLRDHPPGDDIRQRADLAASYQEAIVEALAARCRRALPGMRSLAAGGGVSLNGPLRARLRTVAAEAGVPLLLAPPKYCADNAAMIAAVAGAGLGVWGDAAWSADADPSLPVPGTSVDGA
jgi:N6-L-threonylcarbamoyladenine synthase